MKQRVWLLLVLMLWASLGLAQRFRSLDQIQADGTIVIGTEGAFPPFNFFDEGNLVGFDIEIGQALAERLGVKYEWKAQAFDTLLIALNQGRFDFVIASHTITPERAQAVDFTKPYYCTGNLIVALPGGPRTPEELKGKVVGVQVGTTYFEYAQTIEGIKEIKTYQTNPDALQDLLNQRIDAWITDQFTALEAMKQRDVELQLSDLLVREEIGIAVAKGNETLLAALNNALDEILADGTYAAISEKWFGQDIRCK
ncbi:ABC transporter substrate-binding protein [Marinithermus hydrothermalis]|uniref:ABC-type transporter, periplasmic subunit family 3 n=1 Tax=Marinithermus hydrothermalis (strain DSM 14884 / JCM 11576 / T1) TaxID=869210 RepID=F2NPC8_MARHT|nr:ABC transporter substrate-binding protein [Marinithermus hydrothermalis]AEB12209.1 ABC-type transporter, periplasmic subunit family 3 [Marinithermus hydrothermalis DSM 14884]